MYLKYLGRLRLIQFIILLLLFGCSTLETAQDDSTKEYPITLYISSQNGGYVNPVNIAVEIGYKNKIVDQNFDCGDGHNHSTFKLNLKEGQHQITVTSSNGNAGLDVVFTVDKPLWLSLSYWGKNHFQLHISERPLVFM